MRKVFIDRCYECKSLTFKHCHVPASPVSQSVPPGSDFDVARQLTAGSLQRGGAGLGWAAGLRCCCCHYHHHHHQHRRRRQWRAVRASVGGSIPTGRSHKAGGDVRAMPNKTKKEKVSGVSEIHTKKVNAISWLIKCKIHAQDFSVTVCPSISRAQRASPPGSISGSTSG